VARRDDREQGSGPARSATRIGVGPGAKSGGADCDGGAPSARRMRS